MPHDHSSDDDHDHGPDCDHDHDHAHDPDHDHEPGSDEGPAREVDLTRYEGIEGHVVRELSTCSRELLAVIPRAQFDQSLERRAAALAKKVTLKGFRPGKAPVSRVKILHRETLQREAIEDLIGTTWQAVAAGLDQPPVGSPQLTELDNRDGEPIRFAATFDVLPKVELQGVDAITATNRIVKVTDADVDAELDSLRNMRAELVPTTKEDAAPGDYAVVNVARFKAEGDAEPHDTRTGLVVEVGAEGNPLELDRALLGMGVGETRQFQMLVPEAHGDKALAGQTVQHRIELTAIRERRLPALDDALAKEAAGVDSVDELKKLARERLLEARLRRAKAERDNEIIDQLVQKNPVEMPATLIEQEADVRLRRGLERLASQGVDIETAKVDWPAELQRARESAERDLRADYLLELVARDKSVEASEEDVANEIGVLAARSGKSPIAVRAELEKARRMSDLRGSVRRRRVLDLLGSSATIQVE